MPSSFATFPRFDSRSGDIGGNNSTMLQVSRSSSSGPVGTRRCVDRCCPSTRQNRRADSISSDRTWSMQCAAARRASVDFPCSFRRGSSCAALGSEIASKPGVLRLQVLQLANLVALQPANTMSDKSNMTMASEYLRCRKVVGKSLSLRNQHVHLSQFRLGLKIRLDSPFSAFVRIALSSKSDILQGGPIQWGGSAVKSGKSVWSAAMI